MSGETPDTPLLRCALFSAALRLSAALVLWTHPPRYARFAMDAASLAALAPRTTLTTKLTSLMCLASLGAGVMLLKKGEDWLDYAFGYYEQAKEKLQDAVYTVGLLMEKKGSSDSTELQREKEDTAHLATIMMYCGQRLEEMKEERDEKTK